MRLFLVFVLALLALNKFAKIVVESEIIQTLNELESVA
jgi:hypothetical protein